jgi:hypothetical protein
MQLSEILEQPEGFTPPAVTVTIEKVFAYKSGESDQGPWSFQDIQVTGGGKLKLKGLMHEFPASRVGQTVTIRANQSKTHGLTGMKVAHEQYQGKTYDKLIVTSSAKWDWGNNGQVTQPEVSAQSNGHSTNGTEAAYAGHILACAELANQVVGAVKIDDDQAIQACFATICIDTKNRNILLPKPDDAPALPEPREEDHDPFEPDDSDPIPF